MHKTRFLQLVISVMGLALAGVAVAQVDVPEVAFPVHTFKDSMRQAVYAELDGPSHERR